MECQLTAPIRTSPTGDPHGRGRTVPRPRAPFRRLRQHHRSHYGTTGPLQSNPATGRPWYDFPPFTIRDIVRAHRCWPTRSASGASGRWWQLGREVFRPSSGPFRNRSGSNGFVLIATAAKASPWAIAIDETQRMAIEADTTFGQPRDDAGMKGLAAARPSAC